MDPLLNQMELAGLGSSLGEVYLGVAAHADDIRTLTSNKSRNKSKWLIVLQVKVVLL